MTTATKATAAPKDGMPSMIAYLTRVLKTPTIGAFWEELAAQARDENWSHEEYLAALLQRQVADRESKGTVMRIRTAHFPQVKTLEDFNLDHLPSLRRDVLAHLATGTFVAKAENVVLLGPGTGKSHFTEGLAHAAIEKDLKVAWFTLETLTATINKAKVDGSTARTVAKICRCDLIVVDDIGMLPAGDDAAEAFYRIVDAAYERRSIAVTSNIHPSGFDTIMPKTLATATVDRLLHHAHLVLTKGDSHRLAEALAGKGVVSLA